MASDYNLPTTGNPFESATELGEQDNYVPICMMNEDTIKKSTVVIIERSMLIPELKNVMKEEVTRKEALLHVNKIQGQ